MRSRPPRNAASSTPRPRRSLRPKRRSGAATAEILKGLSQNFTPLMATIAASLKQVSIEDADLASQVTYTPPAAVPRAVPTVVPRTPSPANPATPKGDGDVTPRAATHPGRARVDRKPRSSLRLEGGLAFLAGASPTSSSYGNTWVRCEPQASSTIRRRAKSD